MVWQKKKKPAEGGGEKKKKAKSGFSVLGLDKLVFKGAYRTGYTTPTPIQKKAIPLLVQGRDVVAMARTGSGKTAAFVLPMLHRLGAHSSQVGTRAVILSPTRELAMQTHHFCKQLGRLTDLRYCLIAGGFSINSQFSDLATNPDVIVASPGRLLHILEEAKLRLSAIEYVVLDEADRLFEMGFQQQISDLMRKMPENRQMALFSATLPGILVEFARAGLHGPQLIRLDTEIKISPALKTAFFSIREDKKWPALIYLLKKYILPSAKEHLTIVFFATKHHVEHASQVLHHACIDHSFIHGSMDQECREVNLKDFAKHKVPVMLVTDIAARGLDIPLINNVINFNFPYTPKLYVHRVGRAARQGRPGTAYSLVAPDEVAYMIDLHLFLGRPLSNEVKSSKVPNVDGDEFEEVAGGLEVGKFDADKEEDEDQSGQAKMSKEDENVDALYGDIPDAELLDETESLIKLVQNDMEAEGTLRRSINGMKMYVKTRPASSVESQRRARDIIKGHVKVHPWLRVGNDDMDAQRDMESAIKSFRPQATVFELTGVNVPRPANKRKRGSMDIVHSLHAYQAALDAEQDSDTHTTTTTTTTTCKGSSTQAPPQKKQKKLSLTQALSAPGGLGLDWQNLTLEHGTDGEGSKDKQFFLEYRKTENYEHEKNSYSINGGLTPTIQLTADSAEDMTKQRQVFAWDKKKKKFIKMSLDDAKQPNKKRTNEANKRVDMKKSGKLFAQWEARTNLHLQIHGEEEDSALVAAGHHAKKNRFMKEDIADEQAANAGKKGKGASQKSKKGNTRHTKARVVSDVSGKQTLMQEVHQKRREKKKEENVANYKLQKKRERLLDPTRRKDSGKHRKKKGKR